MKEPLIIKFESFLIYFSWIIFKNYVRFENIKTKGKLIN